MYRLLRPQHLRPRHNISLLKTTRPSSSSSTTKAQPHPSRLHRLESRLPRFLQRYTRPLRTAPVSHITAFLILHELTAVIPLFGLAAAFHYFEWLPPYFSEGAWVKEGMERFGRYARRKGWVGDEEVVGGDDVEVAKKGGARWWGRGEGGVRIVVELATAWAVTKALLPLRLALSVWATPWFARVTMLPAWNLVKRFAGKTSAAVLPVRATASPAAGTNAVGGRVVSSSKPL